MYPPTVQLAAKTQPAAGSSDTRVPIKPRSQSLVFGLLLAMPSFHKTPVAYSIIPLMLTRGYPYMTTKRMSKAAITRQLKASLAKEPGLTVKDLAYGVDVNRQFMAGFLAALEERGEVSCRKVGPARIYFNVAIEGH